MKLLQLTALTVSISLAATSVQAFSLQGLFGNKENTAGQAGVSQDALNKGIDSIAGEGTVGILNGSISPEVAFAGKKLGIPSQYLPQVQQLYDQYKGGNAVTVNDVNQQQGLSSWLEKKPGLDAATLVDGLSRLFAAQ